MTHKTQRIEPSFSKWLEDLNFLIEMSQRIKTLLKKWLEELIFWKISIKIKKLFWWLTELNFLKKNMTHRIESFFPDDSRNWTFLFNMTQRIELFVEHDSKNWTFCWTWLEQLIELFFFRTTQDFAYDSKNRTFFFSNMTQRIEPFLKIFSKKFSVRFTELNFFQHYLKNGTFESMGQRIELLLKLHMTQRIGFLVKWNLTQRIEPSLLHNPKKWFFLTQRIEPFLSDRTRRIEPFLFESKTWELAFEHDSMIWASFLHDSKNWTFSGIWLNGLNTFL